MELISLLKNWKGGGGTLSSAAGAPTHATTTVAASVLRSSSESDDDDDDDDGETEEDGSFIDLEFNVPVEEEVGGEKDYKDYSTSESESEEDEKEVDFAMRSNESYKRGSFQPDRSLSFFPSDDLFFKGRVLPLEPSCLAFAPSEPDSKPQFGGSLLRSATKLRIFAFGLKKTKSSPAELNVASPAPMEASRKQHQRKLFIKFKAEEVPIVSLFTRDNSSRSSGSSRSSKFHAADGSLASEEKRFSKDVVQKYLNKIKPLYVRVSKRYGEKLRFSGSLSSVGSRKVSSAKTDGGERGSVAVGACRDQKRQAGNTPAGFMVVARHLRKSRSASSAMAAVRSPPPPRRRDDSLLEQQDGIQSAIAHCKRSFNAEKGTELPLVRSRSDPGDGRSLEGLGNGV
ncbi:probable membrane-associated kinase regulator 2 [Phoenix dactylifera]|uniref:Probable membrane-associated kinase regulator 2 n=1 Tax=Phoenix dactylifera TaxID=42345 RepID=A0A8B7C617_PHODC|nr:probable membrane-associated kinase regulator 2 [Phoenix dactylifera]